MKDKWIGKNVKDSQGREYKVKKRVAIGGQGSVYEEETGQYMVKLIHSNNPAHREELSRRFSWLARQTLAKEARLVTPLVTLEPPLVGYVMKKVRGHVPLSKYIKPTAGQELSEWYNIQTGGLRKRLYLGALLASSFSRIQLQGLSYCDVSPNNILVGKQAMSVCLIDSDNLSVPGRAESLVMGTPRYIAPELIKKLYQPNPLSDVYSFAVILFEMIRLGHPLLGDIVHDAEPEEEERALAGHYPYIDHPTDESNRSSRILPKEMFTPKLQELFQQMFVDGLHNRLKRPSMRDFYQACLEAAETTAECEKCGATYYFEKDKEEQVCPWCAHHQPKGAYVKFLKFIQSPKDLEMKNIRKSIGILVLRQGGNAIFSRHFDPSLPHEKLGVLDYQPTEGIQFINQSGRSLQVYKGDKKQKVSIAPNQTVSLEEQDLLFSHEHTVKTGHPGTQFYLYAQIVKGE